MKIHNLYEDENGESHFRDIEIEWVEERNFSKYSASCLLYTSDAADERVRV